MMDANVTQTSEIRVIEFNSDTVEVVRKKINLHEAGRLEEAVDILERWIQHQNHFVKKDFPREYLEITLINAKGLVERAKQRLDKLCTLKTLMPEYFLTNITKDIFTSTMNIMFSIFLPKLTKDHRRVIVVKVIPESCHLLNHSVHHLYIKQCIVILEYFMRNGYNTGVVVIFDYRDVNILSHITKINPIELKNIATFLQEGYGFRVDSVNILTSSKMADSLVSLGKQFMGEKLTKRIEVNKDLESLHENVDKDILPRDLGGKEISSIELRDQQWKFLCSENNLRLTKEMYMAKTDEKRREALVFNDSYIGMPGTFRTLNVD